jgi:signal transduction histidine kinase
MGEQVRVDEGLQLPLVLCIMRPGEARRHVLEALQRDGFRVSLAETGLSGVAAAERACPNLVLVDYHLPDLEGAAVAIHLRRTLGQLPIVAVAEPGHDHKLALSAGCNGVVDTPADLAILGSSLREFINGKSEHLQSAEEQVLLKECSGSLVLALEEKLTELTAANVQLTAVDQFKTEFLQTISHELASPLTPIVGYLRILESERLGALNPKQSQVVRAMIASAERLGRTVDNLADFASLETGEYHVRPSRVDPAALLVDVISTRHSQAKSKRIAVRTVGLAPGQLEMRADARRLGQAMASLLENAIKFSPVGSDVLIELLARGTGISFSVYDQGPGIPRDEQSRIFQPFNHVERAGCGDTGGAGLGLSVARKIIESHGGRIGLESPPRLQPESGRHFSGARFYFEIPSFADDPPTRH